MVGGRSLGWQGFTARSRFKDESACAPTASYWTFLKEICFWHLKIIISGWKNSQLSSVGQVMFLEICFYGLRFVTQPGPTPSSLLSIKAVLSTGDGGENQDFDQQMPFRGISWLNDCLVTPKFKWSVRNGWEGREGWLREISSPERCSVRGNRVYLTWCALAWVSRHFRELRNQLERPTSSLSFEENQIKWQEWHQKQVHFTSWGSAVFSFVGVYLHQVTCKVTSYCRIFNISVNIHILAQFIIFIDSFMTY